MGKSDAFPDFSINVHGREGAGKISFWKVGYLEIRKTSEQDVTWGRFGGGWQCAEMKHFRMTRKPVISTCHNANMVFNTFLCVETIQSPGTLYSKALKA